MLLRSCSTGLTHRRSWNAEAEARVFACVLALKDIKLSRDDYNQISEMMNGGKSHALTSASNYKRLTAPCLRP